MSFDSQCNPSPNPLLISCLCLSSLYLFILSPSAARVINKTSVTGSLYGLWNLPEQIWNMALWVDGDGGSWYISATRDERLFNGVSSRKWCLIYNMNPTPNFRAFLCFFPHDSINKIRKRRPAQIWKDSAARKKKLNFTRNFVYFLPFFVSFNFVFVIEIEMSAENQVKLISFLCASICRNWTWDKIK